ncbi:MAG: hypothetical protein KF829_06860 [Ferruginibacter sp.]|nr:hypothetical protein [Ferruginibacter sp.]
MLRGLIIFLLLFTCCFVHAQQKGEQFVYASPTGNFIMLPFKLKEFDINKIGAYKLERSEVNKNSFSTVRSFEQIKSYAQFEKIAGEQIATSFKSFIKAKNNEEVFTFLSTSRPLKDYGLYILNIDFLRAIGLVYLDEMPQSQTQKYSYRLTVDGNTIQQDPLLVDKKSLPVGSTSKLLTTDSLVSITWTFPKTKTEMPLFAKIYRQDNGKGKYNLLPSLRTINSLDGVQTLFLDEVMPPEGLFNYYVEAVDYFGNEGYPSDTISAVTINFKKIPGIQNLVISDTLDGLYCSWSALPLKPYYTGIQILRSRDAMKDFIVLDTVAAKATSYLDNQVLNNVTYYYKFRPLVYKLSGWGEIIATSFHGTKGAGKDAPLPPKNLSAYQEDNNIRLIWDPNLELNHFAYYVMRGTSKNNMEIVSRAIIDTTWLDSSAVLSGRTNYIYSVIAMNNNQLKSAPSSPVGIRPERAGFIKEPVGISVRMENGKPLISWPDVSKGDATVAGYIIYRRKVDEKIFKPISTEIIAVPYFVDATAEKNVQYVYTVATADEFGYESVKSPEAEFIIKERIDAPLDFYVRKISSGVEIKLPQNDNPDVKVYNVYRRLLEQKSFVKIGSTKSGSDLFIDNKFLPGKLNIYAITAVTTFGESEKSIEKSIFVEKN